MTVDEIAIQISASAEQAITQLDQVAGKVNALAGDQPLRLLLDTTSAGEKLDALRRTANRLLTDLNGNQTTAAALAASRTQYASAIKELQTLKSLSRTTFEQELEYLQAIRDNMDQYNLSAEEALDLERRLMNAQAQLDARDAASLDNLLNGIVTALSNRYEAMRDAELDTLNESRDAWKAWQEDNTDAIQAQIDALDDLTEAEDRAAEEDSYVRKIEKLKQALEYEQNDYNREQLTRQLTAAEEDYGAWQTQTAREDEKAALTEQLAAVNEKTQAELEALDEQADAINEAYAKRLSAASLQAEAEAMLMSGSQKDILKLITQYAPEYNATGQTLGEKLLAGFMKKVGSVGGWADALNGMIQKMQDRMNRSLQDAAGDFYRRPRFRRGIRRQHNPAEQLQYPCGNAC